jgi:hypothetical protein
MPDVDDAKCGAGSGIRNFGPTRQRTYHAHAWALGGCRGLLTFRELRHQLANSAYFEQ